MNLHQFLLIMLARKKIILATLAVTLLLTLGFSVMQQTTYKATASVLLNYKGVEPLTGLTMPGQLLPGHMATQMDIIASTEGRGNVRDWLAELLLKKRDILPSRESSVVEISFKSSDPQFAAAVANAFADEYQRISVQLKTEPMKKAPAYFYEQTKLLRDNVETAQARPSKYQQEKGIVSLDFNRADIELARLNDLSQQLVAVQGREIEANSRGRIARGGFADSPDVVNNGLIQSLRITLATAEARFSETLPRLAPNHPHYRSSEAELDKMRADLASALGAVSHSFGTNAVVQRQREAELRGVLVAQKVKVRELNRATSSACC